MRGDIGQRTYYSCLMKLNAIPKMFTFRDWIEFTPEDREQRILNKNRVPEIARYILDNEDGYIFSAITASYKCPVEFKPATKDSEIGTLEMEFVRENPAIGEESVSVLLFPYENKDRVQQMFSDLNRNVAKTSKSLDILFDHRDPMAQVTQKVCEQVDSFKDMVEKDAVSLPVRSKKLFSLAALYDANNELLKATRDDEDATVNAMVAVALDYWITVSKMIPDWSAVKRGEIKPLELRQEKISSHAVVMRALGGAGAELMQAAPDDWKDRLQALRTIDWAKKNPDWENVCIIANSVVSNRQARVATKAYIKKHLGLKLTEGEERALLTNTQAAAAAEAVA
jgi:DNA sulfur modification protein DndB